jgi:hypothetical protein
MRAHQERGHGAIEATATGMELETMGTERSTLYHPSGVERGAKVSIHAPFITIFGKSTMTTRRDVFARLMHAAILLLILSTGSRGQSGFTSPYNVRPLGFGISFGEPLACSMRYHLAGGECLNVAIGKSNMGAFHFQADIQWVIRDAFPSDVISLYSGVGFVLGIGQRGRQYLFYSDTDSHDNWFNPALAGKTLGIKGALGLTFTPRIPKLEFFVECSPILALEPGFGVDVQPSLGLRYYP